MSQGTAFCPLSLHHSFSLNRGKDVFKNRYLYPATSHSQPLGGRCQPPACCCAGHRRRDAAGVQEGLEEWAGAAACTAPMWWLSGKWVLLPELQRENHSLRKALLKCISDKQSEQNLHFLCKCLRKVGDCFLLGLQMDTI